MLLNIALVELIDVEHYPFLINFKIMRWLSLVFKVNIVVNRSEFYDCIHKPVIEPWQRYFLASSTLRKFKTSPHSSKPYTDLIISTKTYTAVKPYKFPYVIQTTKCSIILFSLRLRELLTTSRADRAKASKIDSIVSPKGKKSNPYHPWSDSRMFVKLREAAP